MPSKRNTMLKKMQENREQAFRPRFWTNRGNPLIKEELAKAMENARLAENTVNTSDADREKAKFSLSDQDGGDRTDGETDVERDD